MRKPETTTSSLRGDVATGDPRAEPAACSYCGAGIRARSPATRRTFLHIDFECGGEFVGFDAGEVKHCVTDRWTQLWKRKRA